MSIISLIEEPKTIDNIQSRLVFRLCRAASSPSVAKSVDRAIGNTKFKSPFKISSEIYLEDIDIP
jgi:hypothetical protein